MRPTLKWLLALPVALLVVAATSKPAEATPIVSIMPSLQNALVGDTVTVDILVSGLTEPTGGFSVTLGFDPAILGGTSYVIGAGFGSVIDQSFGFGFPGPGFLDLYVFSYEALGTLGGLQGTSFVMATITFQALSAGLSPITLGNLVLANEDGSSTLALTSTNGAVCVGGNCPVPEPSTVALVSMGLFGVFAVAVRRRRAAR